MSEARAAGQARILGEAQILGEASDDAATRSLARDMIEVHGTEAATVARNNARAAAVAAQLSRARSWIRVLTLIQRQEADRIMRPHGPGSPPATVP